MKASILDKILFLGLVITFSACKKEETNFDPTVFINNASTEEGDQTQESLIFTLKLNQQINSDVSVNYTTQSGSAIKDQDFISASGLAVIPAGETETKISIEIIPDELSEENEDFSVVLSNAVNAAIAVSKGTGTIINDDEFVDEGYTTPLSYPGLTLVWADEFDGIALNTSDWSYETGAGGWGNSELQNYQSGTSNATVSNGQLVIEAKKVGAGYTSARIVTKAKQSFKYGRIDIRARLPKGKGLWPALWMLGENFSSIGWPACGEIDIMELIGSEPNKILGTAHWDNQGSIAKYGGNKTLNSGIFADQFHVFTITWDSQAIRWFLDDVQYHVIDITAAELSEFHEEFFFIFNVAVGGTLPGSPDASTVFPQKMTVDYVRVFQ